MAAAFNKGKVLGFTTKSFLPNYGEFYEMRHFYQGPEEARKIRFGSDEVLFGPNLLFVAKEMVMLCPPNTRSVVDSPSPAFA